jgi:hypothetical protein
MAGSRADFNSNDHHMGVVLHALPLPLLLYGHPGNTISCCLTINLNVKMGLALMMGHQRCHRVRVLLHEGLAHMKDANSSGAAHRKDGAFPRQ